MKLISQNWGTQKIIHFLPKLLESYGMFLAFSVLDIYIGIIYHLQNLTRCLHVNKHLEQIDHFKILIGLQSSTDL